MALHKFLIEHAIWPAMEKRKGNKIREIQRALEKSQYEDVAALQREGLTELLLHCKAHVPAYESVLPDEDTIRQTRMRRCGAFSRWQSGPFRRRQRRIWRTMCRNRRALQTAPAARPENRYAFS